MTPKIYVENIASAATEADLKDLFSKYGGVTAVNIVVDPTHKKPGGFGFVTMETPEGARAAIRALHRTRLAENILTVTEAWPSEDSAESTAETRRSGRPVRTHVG